MAHGAAYSSSARGGHAEAAYALVRLVRGVLSVSPGRKRGDPSDDRNLSVVFRGFPGVCDEAGGRYGAAGAFHRGDLSALPVQPRGARAQERDDPRPRRKARVPAVPTWDTVKVLLQQCGLRERSILGLMAYGGLRRGEVAALDIGDVAPDFGLRRVMGKGGHEVPVALPASTRAILRDYIATERAGLPASAPLFVVTYKHSVGQRIERRITGQRIWKVVQAVGTRAGMPG